MCNWRTMGTEPFVVADGGTTQENGNAYIFFASA